MTIIAPIIFSFLGLFFKIKYCAKGIMIKFVPVMKADLDAEVNFNPNVCKENPKNRKIPSMIPYFHSLMCESSKLFPYANKNIKSVIRNLMNTKKMGETNCRETFIKGNERPHVNVTKSKINSAL